MFVLRSVGVFLCSEEKKQLNNVEYINKRDTWTSEASVRI